MGEVWADVLSTARYAIFEPDLNGRLSAISRKTRSRFLPSPVRPSDFLARQRLLL